MRGRRAKPSFVSTIGLALLLGCGGNKDGASAGGTGGSGTGQGGSGPSAGGSHGSGGAAGGSEVGQGAKRAPVGGWAPAGNLMLAARPDTDRGAAGPSMAAWAPAQTVVRFPATARVPLGRPAATQRRRGLFR